MLEFSILYAETSVLNMKTFKNHVYPSNLIESSVFIIRFPGLLFPV